MSFRYTPWSNQNPQIWALRGNDGTKYGGKILHVSINKEEVYTQLAYFEAAGVSCWVENPKGERVS